MTIFSRTLVVALLLFPRLSLAQVELTGTYVRYLAVGGDGAMICASGACARHSMQYRETESSTPSCDLYNDSGTIREAFTIEATAATEVRITNSGSGADGFTTVSPVAIAGRTITWSGMASTAGVSLRVDQTFAYEVDANYVRLTVVVTNTGTNTLTDVYYLRNTDPDHGWCNIGSSYSTYNDVLRQPPTSDGALTTARAGDPGRVLVLGMGAHDPRARAHNGGFVNLDASAEWSAPRDGGGARNDEAVDLVFREPSLGPGASTTFEIYYVWGTSEAEVTERFDEIRFPSAPCAGLAEGALCSTATATGSCRAGLCCTGCFDGTSCRLGTTASACGVGGGMCAACSDGNVCTVESCTAGVCGQTPAPATTACDDGAFCTSMDRCDGAGRCAGTALQCDDREDCTIDGCDEAADRCTATPRADGTACVATRTGICGAGRCCTGCFEGTTCVAGTSSTSCGAGGGACASCNDGDPCSSDVCTTGVCSHPPAPSTTACDDGLFCTLTDRCNGAGACVGSGAARCDDRASCTSDMCDEATDRCVYTHTSGCLIGGGCVNEGAVNPTYPCQICDPELDPSDWTALAAGTECGEPFCAAGRRTTRACDAMGACLTMPPVDCPSGMCSSDTECGATCVRGGCPAGMWCDPETDRCAMQSPAGAACSFADQCRGALMCTGGVCCAQVCEGDCVTCNGRGECGPVRAGTDPDGDCGTGFVCDGTGLCVPDFDAGPSGEDAGMTDPDAGRDAGMPIADAGNDAGMIDGGMTTEDGGCGCRASQRSPSLVLLAPLIVWVLRRRKVPCPR